MAWYSVKKSTGKTLTLLFNTNGREYSGDLGVDGSIIRISINLEEVGWEVWIGFI
jgi:hypothetical protein